MHHGLVDGSVNFLLEFKGSFCCQGVYIQPDLSSVEFIIEIKSVISRQNSSPGFDSRDNITLGSASSSGSISLPHSRLCRCTLRGLTKKLFLWKEPQESFGGFPHALHKINPPVRAECEQQQIQQRLYPPISHCLFEEYEFGWGAQSSNLLILAHLFMKGWWNVHILISAISLPDFSFF